MGRVSGFMLVFVSNCSSSKLPRFRRGLPRGIQARDSPPPGGIPGSYDVIMTSQRGFLKVTAVNVLVWSPGAIECATPRLAPSCLAVRGVSPDAVCLHSNVYFFYKKLHFDTATFQTRSACPAHNVMHRSTTLFFPYMHFW